MVGIAVIIILIPLLLLVAVIHSIIRYRRLTFIKEKSIPGGWLKIIVPVENCEIRCRDYYEEKIDEELPGSIEMLDSLYGRNSDVKREKKSICVVLYKRKNQNGDLIEHRSDPIYSAPELVRYSFLNKSANIVLHVDPQNSNNYYLDVTL